MQVAALLMRMPDLACTQLLTDLPTQCQAMTVQTYGAACMTPIRLHAWSFPSIYEQGIGASHLRALAALPRLTQLNLYHLHWAGDAVQLGLGWLAAQLPRLKVLNCPDDVLVRPWCLPASHLEPHMPPDRDRQRSEKSTANLRFAASGVTRTHACHCPGMHANDRVAATFNLIKSTAT